MDSVLRLLAWVIRMSRESQRLGRATGAVITDSDGAMIEIEVVDKWFGDF